MSTFVHSVTSKHLICIQATEFYNILALKSRIVADKVSPQDVYVLLNGRLVGNEEPVQENAVYQIAPRLFGGKGGFGSMLRAIGAQIEKTTNHEACRDLSGRRMRDVNNEKDLKEWLGKQSEKERERQQQREERTARRRAMPNHKFDDPLYHQQKSLVAENQMDALQKGLQKVHQKPSSSTASATVTSAGDSSEEEQVSLKRKTGEEVTDTLPTKKIKPATEWLGIDVDNLSDLDNEEEDTQPNSGDDSNSTSIDKNTNSDMEQGSLHCTPESNSDSHNGTKEMPLPSDSTGKDICEEKDITKISEKEEKKHGLLQALPPVVGQQNCKNSKEELQPQDIGPVNLEALSSPEELEVFGLEKLKTELMSRGLKCGGTLQERTKRLFSTKGLTPDQFDPSILAKPSKGKKKK